MAVGDSALLGGLSYLAVGRETTFGTYNTCTGTLDFISSGLKTQKDLKILEQIERSRTYTKALSLSKSVGGDLSFYFRPLETASGFILQNAFGGTVTSATSTGEATGGSSFEHIFVVGAMDQSYPSLCINHRKGPSSGGKIFEYSGVRVNEFSIDAQIDEPIMVSASLICKDATVTTNDVESVLTITANSVLSFVDGRVSVENSFASLTSSSFWHVQSVTFNISNNLKSDTGARRIGSDVLDVLPVGVQTYELGMTMRFNTTTAFDAMINGTELSGELSFLGPTISGSTFREELLLEFQKLQVIDAGDPEVSGPDNILTSDVTFAVLRDESASGYAVRATVRNNIANYS